MLWVLSLPAPRWRCRWGPSCRPWSSRSRQSGWTPRRARSTSAAPWAPQPEHNRNYWTGTCENFLELSFCNNYQNHFLILFSLTPGGSFAAFTLTLTALGDGRHGVSFLASLLPQRGWRTKLDGAERAHLAAIAGIAPLVFCSCCSFWKSLVHDCAHVLWDKMNQTLEDKMNCTWPPWGHMLGWISAPARLGQLVLARELESSATDMRAQWVSKICLTRSQGQL